MMRERYCAVRKLSEKICEPLHTEDYVVQPVVDVSPPKWHLGHTTWFFETFVLKPFLSAYSPYHPGYGYIFNSYYQAAGKQVLRTDRGNLTRPTVSEVYQYRRYVDEAMEKLLDGDQVNSEVAGRIELGLNHEQQHQELLWTDIKYILGHNPLFPAYSEQPVLEHALVDKFTWLQVEGGIHQIGYRDKGFCYDNELKPHKVYLNDFAIASGLVSNGEFIEFIESDAYRDFRYWHSEGWDWVNSLGIRAPLYWHKVDGIWYRYTRAGLQPVKPGEPLCHVSYYEAAAFAAWKGCRLPTEFEWEAASDLFAWGQRWEWTESAYLPYPGFIKADGAIGEYNGKFMVNQKVLRGASVATSPGHSRKTYRNFFHPPLRWQYTGIRLAK